MSVSLMSALTRHDVERIHEHSLDLLERVGINYQTPRALEILEKLGCPVDYTRNWASVPREAVEWALERAPRVVRLAARDPARDVVLDGRRPHHTTDSQGTQAIDLETGQCRDSTTEDLKRGLLFADVLDKIEIVNVMVAVNDVPAHVRTIRHFALAFTQTSKHVRTGVLHARQVPFIVELARAVTTDDGFRPIFSAVDCTISPLMHDGPMTEACIELAKLRVPILVYPMPLAGGTSPVTRGGTLLVHNVEFLSGLVLFQAVNPGTPIIYGTGASQLDMHTGRYGGSANLNGLWLALCAMCRYYNLPVEIYSMGLLGSSQILSLDKMVLDNHLAHQLEEMVRPIVLDEAHLQAGLIEKVGIGGHYLSQRETRTFTRQEYVPVWPPAGKSMTRVAHGEALEILHTHIPPALPPGAADRIENIVAEADSALA